MDSRLWLSHAVNATLDMSMETVPDLDGISSVEWMSAKHGFDHGQVSDLLNDELVSKLRVEYSEVHAVNLVMHKLHLGLSLLGLIERRDAALELIACCALSLDVLRRAFSASSREEGQPYPTTSWLQLPVTC